MPNPCLEVISGNCNTTWLQILDKVFIGRCCSGIDKKKRLIVYDAMVSRDHTVINRNGSHLRITDTSKNGTWVNDVRVSAGWSHDLLDGDVVRVGDALIRLRCPASMPLGEDEDSSPERTAIRTVESIVTNLVADVRGFSSISQKENSLEVYEFIKRLFETLSPIIHDFKGTIKDYAGDAVYAFWDHRSVPSREKAVLACQAAIKQARTVESIRRQLSNRNPTLQNLRMGWGVTTGKVTISHYGSRVADVAIVGDSTNLAFRLSAIANKDLSSEIITCSQTAALVREALSVSDLGFVCIRGRSGREQVFGILV